MRGAQQEVFGQQRHILAPLAQRRQGDAHDIQAMQQVGAEFAALHLGVEILVRGGDDAHVGPDQFASADAVELALGQHAQQPRLQQQRHVADLVQEERAAIGLFEASCVTTRRAGEGAGFVAEQFRLQQFRGNRRGIERDEWCLRARAVHVQRTRHQLLAGAGFAGDEGVEIGRRDASDRAEDLAHRRAATDQVLAGRRRGHGCRRGRRLRQRAPRGFHGLIEVEGLGQIVEGAQAIGRCRRRHVGEGTHDDDRNSGMLGVQAFQQLESRQSGHAHVGEDRLRVVFAEGGQQGVGVFECAHRPARLAQRLAQHEADGAVVVDDP